MDYLCNCNNFLNCPSTVHSSTHHLSSILILVDLVLCLPPAFFCVGMCFFLCIWREGQSPFQNVFEIDRAVISHAQLRMIFHAHCVSLPRSFRLSEPKDCWKKLLGLRIFCLNFGCPSTRQRTGCPTSLLTSRANFCEARTAHCAF